MSESRIPDRLQMDPEQTRRFQDLDYVLRGEAGPVATDPRMVAWVGLTGMQPRRDYVAIDESGDFDEGLGVQKHSFLVTAAFHTDGGSYQRVAEFFLPWRHIVYEGQEVKASSGRLKASAEERFLEELRLLCSEGHCAVTIGVVDKIEHRGGALLARADVHELRMQLHDALLRRHLRFMRPRSSSLRVLIDQYGAASFREDEYKKRVKRLLDDLELGIVGPRVDFCDSVVVELIQISDLVAGTLRKRLVSGDFDLLQRVSSEFVVRDLTERSRPLR